MFTALSSSAGGGLLPSTGTFTAPARAAAASASTAGHVRSSSALTATATPVPGAAPGMSGQSAQTSLALSSCQAAADSMHALPSDSKLQPYTHAQAAGQGLPPSGLANSISHSKQPLRNAAQPRANWQGTGRWPGRWGKAKRHLGLIADKCLVCQELIR